MFSDKPVSVRDYSFCDDYEVLLCPKPIKSFLENGGFCKSYPQKVLIWRKYRHLYIHKFYILDNETDFYKNCFVVVLINKEAFIETVNQNLDLFRKELKEENLEVKELLRRIEYMKSFKYHEGLLGILLGYGRHNAMLFYRKTQLDKVLRRYRKNKEFKFALEFPLSFSRI